MPERDDLDALLGELWQDDSGIHTRVAAALERRELARELAAHRRAAGLTQIQIAQRMKTSQGQVVRFEAGADCRLSTVARYAAALGQKVSWHLEPAAAPARTPRRVRPAKATA